MQEKRCCNLWKQWVRQACAVCSNLMRTEAKWIASKHSDWLGGRIVWLYLWNPSMFFLPLSYITCFSFSPTPYKSHHDPACTFWWLSWQQGSIPLFPLSSVSVSSELPRQKVVRIPQAKSKTHLIEFWKAGSGSLSCHDWQSLGAFSRLAVRCLPTCGDGNNQVAYEREKISNHRCRYRSGILAWMNSHKWWSRAGIVTTQFECSLA